MEKERYIVESMKIILDNNKGKTYTVQDAVNISEFLWEVKQKEQASKEPAPKHFLNGCKTIQKLANNK